MDVFNEADKVSLNHFQTHIGKLGEYRWRFVRHTLVCYLQLIRRDSLFNQTVAKVYSHGGKITHSIKVNLTEHPDYDFIGRTIMLEQEYLQREVVQQVANRMELSCKQN